MIDPVTAQKLSQRLGIDRFTVVREFIQIVFLNEFYALGSIGNTVFKGGTALRLMFGSNRYSEDLDFTTDMEKSSLDEVVLRATEAMRKQIPKVEVKELRTLTGVSKRLAVMTDLSTRPLTIKLDFSQRESVFQIKQGVIKTDLPVVPAVLISYLDPEEILAEKYRAIMTRTKGRDIYDMWYLLRRGVVWNADLIAKKLDYYKEKYDPQQLVQKISRWEAAELKQDIGKFLPERERGVVDHLLEMLLEELERMGIKSKR